MVNLVDLRRARELSQAALAKELGVSPATIALYETGDRTPRLGIARKIAAYFHVPLDDLEFGPGVNREVRCRCRPSAKS